MYLCKIIPRRRILKDRLNQTHIMMKKIVLAFALVLATFAVSASSQVIPTGIRCEMAKGWVLMIFPRSGLGFRHQTRLSNTVGIIDSDYAFADNEGHIMVSLRNPLERDLVIGRGERFCQGIFLPYGLAEEEDDFAERKGGFGSTGK